MASSFMRSGGGISFEERGAQPGDFTASRGYGYAAEFMADEISFRATYANWQAFADCFVMRRAVVSIEGVMTCNTKDFDAGDLKKYKEPGFVTVKDFRVPGSDRGSIPDGKYQLTSLRFRDQLNSMSEVTVSYQQYGEWKLLKIIDPQPDPRKVTG